MESWSSVLQSWPTFPDKIEHFGRTFKIIQDTRSELYKDATTTSIKRKQQSLTSQSSRPPAPEVDTSTFTYSWSRRNSSAKTSVMDSDEEEEMGHYEPAPTATSLLEDVYNMVTKYANGFKFKHCTSENQNTTRTYYSPINWQDFIVWLLAVQWSSPSHESRRWPKLWNLRTTLYYIY